MASARTDEDNLRRRGGGDGAGTPGGSPRSQHSQQSRNPPHGGAAGRRGGAAGGGGEGATTGGAGRTSGAGAGGASDPRSAGGVVRHRGGQRGGDSSSSLEHAALTGSSGSGGGGGGSSVPASGSAVGGTTKGHRRGASDGSRASNASRGSHAHRRGGSGGLGGGGPQHGGGTTSRRSPSPRGDRPRSQRPRGQPQQPQPSSQPPPTQHHASATPPSHNQQHQPPPRDNPAGGGAAAADQAAADNADPIVTPELLVDALSGHEDGLLAIAERLMEHYDAGYDTMGEAIIDAFADVQKLFQHVVEAAHMEGAAFEASRREKEIEELRRKAEAGGLMVGATTITRGADAILGMGGTGMTGGSGGPNRSGVVGGGGGGSGGHGNDASHSSGVPAGPTRHDEFIDEDVRQVLADAVRKGSALRESGSHAECRRLYETACQGASALLPVDSDHRGRLQLSVVRAESMSPDRACAILRYAMDDVLRSGLNGPRRSHAPLPDASARKDCVLRRPSANDGHGTGIGGSEADGASGPGVAQSSEEALASLVEEMKEVLGAPMYEDTPLQDVAERFWAALAEAQRTNAKNEERLEQDLGKLKGEFLLARAEWEEKLTEANENAESYRGKYQRAMESSQNSRYMEQARSAVLRLTSEHGVDGGGSSGGGGGSGRGTGSIGGVGDSGGTGGQRRRRREFTFAGRTFDADSPASLKSEFVQHARSIVGSLSCIGVGPDDATNQRSARGGGSSDGAGEERYEDRRSRSRAPRSDLVDDADEPGSPAGRSSSSTGHGGGGSSPSRIKRNRSAGRLSKSSSREQRHGTC